MHTKRYTEQQFIDAVATSSSIAQVLVKLNLAAKGGNFATAKKRIKQLNLDTSHMTHQGWSKGKVFGPKRDIQDYLSNTIPIASHALHQRLITSGLKSRICESCQLTTWFGDPIPLELHHIDGNNTNNNLSNLQLLCPNCHARTDNYRGKNIQLVTRASKDTVTINTSVKPVKSRKLRERKPRPTKCPPQTELEILLWQMPTTKIAEKYSVSDKAVEKWCKHYQLTKPPRGYWAKQYAKSTS